MCRKSLRPHSVFIYLSLVISFRRPGKAGRRKAVIVAAAVVHNVMRLLNIDEIMLQQGRTLCALYGITECHSIVKPFCL